MLMDFCVPTLGVVVPWSYLSSKRGLMPQIVAANFIAHDPLAFQIELAFPYMARCKQFSELSSDQNFQCRNV